MVAIFTGFGAGFERGSGAALGSGGLLGSSGLGRGGEGVFLNAATGNLVLQRQDEFLVGRGPDISVARTYNSQGALDDNGDNWRQSTDRRIYNLTGTVNTTGSTVKRVSADGSEIAYTWTGSYYTTTDGAGAHDKLTYSAGIWTWTEGTTQIKETYEAAVLANTWRIKTQVDLDLNTVTYTYQSGADRVASVATADGGAIKYTYDGAGNITAEEVWNGATKTLTRTYYTYESYVVLSQTKYRLQTAIVDETPTDALASDPLSETRYTVTYAYDASNRVNSIEQSDGSKLVITYDGLGRVLTLTQTVGVNANNTAVADRVTSITYNDEGNGLLRTEVTDPRGQVTKVWSKIATGEMTRVMAPPATTGGAPQEVNYTYDGSGNVMSVVTKSGASPLATLSYQYDANGNVTQIIDGNGNVTTRAYNASNSVTLETRTGSTASGAAQPLYTRYVYDVENHLTFTISQEGRVTEYRYTTEGLLSATAEYPQAAAYAAYNGTDPLPTHAGMASWLTSLGDKSYAKVTKYIYDLRGNLAQSTRYGKADASGFASLGDGITDQYFVYDQAGQLLSRYVNSQQTETFVYDGLGRLLASTDLNGGTTTIVFADHKDIGGKTYTTVTTGLNYTSVSTYNKAGDLITRSDSVSADAHTSTGAAQYFYDANGNLRRTIDATGRKIFYLYDNQNRKVADVSQDGAVVEYKYDAAGRLAATVRYNTFLTSTQVAALDVATPAEIEFGSASFLRPAADNATAGGADLWSWSVYDAGGRVTKTIGGDGAVATYAYDQSDRLIATTVYYNKLSAADVAALIAGTLTAANAAPTADGSGRDRLTRSFFDGDGRLIGALNAEGYLSEIIYDAAGQKIQEIGYAAATNVANRASGTFATLKTGLANGANDVTTRYVYDGQGLLRFTIDALSRVSELVYHDGTNIYATGLVRKTIAYSAALGSVADYKYATIKTAVALLASAANDRVSYNVYNDRSQLSYTVDASGAVAGFVYDSEDRVIRTTRYATLFNTTTIGIDSAWKANLDTWAANNGANARITRTFYNKHGQTRYVVDAENYVSEFVYDAEGRVTSETRYTSAITATNATTIDDVKNAGKGTPFTTSYGYDSSGRAADVTDANGTVRHISYFANGAKSHEIVAYGQGALDEATSYFEYDQSGKLIRQVEGYGQTEAATTLYEYDGQANLTKVTDPRGNITTYSYDKVARLKKRTDALGVETTYDYDAFGRGVRTIVDPTGLNIRSHAYFDQLGRVTKSVDAEGYVTETAYTAFGEILSATRRYVKTTGADIGSPPGITPNALDATTVFEYDKLGRLTKTTDALAYYEQYTLDAFGQRTAVRNKLGGWTNYSYDKLGRVKSETLPINSVDSTGAVVATSVTNNFSYDSRGNLTEKVEAAGLTEARTTTYGYDPASRLTSVSTGTASRVTSATAALASPTLSEQYYYDRRGNLIEKVDAVGARTLFWYDKLDRVTDQLSATGTLTHNVYDTTGNVTEKRVYADLVGLPANANGAPPTPAGSGTYRVTQYAYDALNRLTDAITPNVVVANYATALAVTTQNLVTHYDYDGLGNVVKSTDARGAITWAYFDKLGRKTTQIDALNYRTDWTYDGDGNVLSETRYANVGPAPTGTGSPPALPTTDNANDRATTFAYDMLGRRLSESRANVVVHNGAGGVGTVSSTIAYQYNGLSQVTRKTEATGDTIDYVYDVGGRMASEQRSGYTDYNGAAVTPRIEYSYNGLSALSRAKAVGNANAVERITTYAYGAGGVLASKTDAEGFTHTYRYDAAGRLRRDEYARVLPNNTTVTEAIGYDYDLEGRLTQQGILASSGGVWSRSVLVGGFETNATAMMQYNAFGEVSARGVNNVYAEKFEYDLAGRLWRTNTGDGVWKYFMYDQNGNQTLAVVSEGTDIGDVAITSLNQVLDLWGATRANIGTNYVDGVVATTTSYDARNQATSVREPQRQLSTTVKSDLVSTRAYNAFGETAYEINPTGARIDYAYNTMGRLTSMTSPSVEGVGENGLWIAGYDANHNVLSTSSTAVTFRPVELRYYDASGRIVASRDANNNLTKMTLLAGTGYGGAQALVTELYAADGGVTRTKFDIHGDARRIESPLYNAATAPQYVALQSFDKMGRLVQLTHAGGLIDYYAYDGLGQRIKHANSLYSTASAWTNAEAVTYDRQGRIAEVVAMGGDTTAYAYVWNGALATTGMGVFGGWQQTTTYTNGKTAIENKDVFERGTSKTDLGGNVSSATYDKAGRLTQRQGGTALNYAYYNTSKLAEIFVNNPPSLDYTNYDVDLSRRTGTDTFTYRGTSFTYDGAGNVTLQQTRETGTNYSNPWVDVDGIWHYPNPLAFNRVVSSQTATYDGLGRLITWNEAGYTGIRAAVIIAPASHVISYDANSNVRRSLATYRAYDAFGVYSDTATTQDYWYRYDSMNRMATTKGQLVSGQVARGTTGIDIFYDAAGERAYTIAMVSGTAKREDYSYDAAGRVTLVKSGTNLTIPGTKRADFTYDLMGRVTLQRDFQTDGVTVAYSKSVTYNTKGQVAADTTTTKQGADIYSATSTYSYGAGSLYALGSPTQIDTVNYKNSVQQKTNRTATTYIWRDGAMQSQVKYTPDLVGAPNTFNTSSYVYNTIGGQAQLSQVNIVDGRSRQVTFLSDLLGQVIKRDEEDAVYAGDPHEIWYRFSGRQIGYVGNNGSVDTDYASSIASRTAASGTGPYFNGSWNETNTADFDLVTDSINSYDQGSTEGMYIVQSGDTLQGIAAKLWGDDSLWYKIAEINGLTAESPLPEGLPLIVPAGVVANSNTATTFKPYDPLEVLGNLSPTAIAPPRGRHGCGGFGQILLAVIAIVVTIWTAGALAPMFGGTAAAGGTFTTGLSVLGGSAGLGFTGAVAVGAAAGAAGSIVSQGIGVMTGIQDKFSWNAVALAAVGGGVGAGVSASPLGNIGGNLGAAVRGVTSSAITQGIGVATGLQKEFSWAGVAAAGVGAALFNQAFGKWFGEGASDFERKLGASTASMIADAATRSLIDGSDFGDNIIAALPNVIGQTIGEAIAGGISHAGEVRAQRRAAAERNVDGWRDRFGDTAEVEDFGEALLAAADHPRSQRARDRVELTARAMLDANTGDSDVAAFLDHTGLAAQPVEADDLVVTGKRDYLMGPTIDSAGIWVGQQEHAIGTAVGQFIKDHPGVGIALQLADAGFAIAGPGRYIGGQVLDHFKNEAAGFIADQMRSDPVRGRRMWAPDLADDGGHGFVFAGSVILGGLGALRRGGAPRGGPRGSGFVRFRDDVETHVTRRDFSVPRRSGIGGAHNVNEFMSASSEFQIVSRTPHPTIAGIERIEYRMRALDRAGNPTGRLQSRVQRKTVYDPSVIPDDEFLAFGRQAAAQAQAAGTLTREWTGVAPNGLAFRGYLDNTGAVRSYFPDW